MVDQGSGREGTREGKSFLNDANPGQQQMIHMPSELHELSIRPKNPTLGLSVSAEISPGDGSHDVEDDRPQSITDIHPAPAPNLSVPVQNLDESFFGSNLREYERPSVDEVDDRDRVSIAESSPWKFISILYLGFPDGLDIRCTGIIVSPHTILTAGHCVHSRDNDGFVNRATAAPGQTQSSNLGSVNQPFGERSANRVNTTARWTNLSGGSTHPRADYKYDYGALFFTEPWTYTNTFMPIVFDDTGGSANSAGYPATVNGVSGNLGMWRHYGLETSDSISFWRNSQIREFALDISGGNSGGPFWNFDPTTLVRELHGISTYAPGGEEIAGGPWMGGGNESLIRSWVNWTPDGDEVPTAEKQGLRLTGVTSGGYPGMSSFLRFYNASANPGSVTVVISAGESGNQLGTWTSDTIPTNASRQYESSQIEAESVPQIFPSESFYAVSIESEFDGYVQHVNWNDEGASLTNLTGCDTGISNDVSTLMNFHSSNLSDGYESTLYFHNVGSEPAVAIVWIYDSVTGEYIGGIQFDEVPPDATYVLTSSVVDYYLNDFYDFTPASNQNHYNVVLSGDFPGYIQHVIDNDVAGVYTNMATKCDLRAN